MLQYQKKRRDCEFFFKSRALFQTSFVFERYLLVFILTTTIKNIQRVIYLCHNMETSAEIFFIPA